MGAWDSVPVLLAGDVITNSFTEQAAALLNATDPDGGLLDERCALKSADQSTAANTTAVNDSELKFSVSANATYLIEGTIWYTCGTTGLMKPGWTVPASATGTWSPAGLNSTVTATFGGILNMAGYPIATSVGIGGSGGSQIVHCRPRGFLKTAATAGVLQFIFAETATDVTLTTVKAGSFIVLKRIA